MEFNADDIHIRRIARDEIRRILDAGLMYTEESKNAPKAKVETKPKQEIIESAAILLSNFPDDLADVVNVSEVNNQWWITKPYERGEEGRKQFARISSIVKALGGAWVADGKNSRWEVPK